MGLIIGSPNYLTANKTILNCLLEEVHCKDDIMEFCKILESAALLLPDSSNLIEIIAKIKPGKMLNSCHMWLNLTKPVFHTHPILQL